MKTKQEILEEIGDITLSCTDEKTRDIDLDKFYDKVTKLVTEETYCPDCKFRHDLCLCKEEE